MNKETTTNVINEASTSETPEENRTGNKTFAENVGRRFVNFYIEITESFPIGTTRPIPPNRRSCLGCIWWKDMSNPKRLR